MDGLREAHMDVLVAVFAKPFQLIALALIYSHHSV